MRILSSTGQQYLLYLLYTLRRFLNNTSLTHIYNSTMVSPKSKWPGQVKSNFSSVSIRPGQKGKENHNGSSRVRHTNTKWPLTFCSEQQTGQQQDWFKCSTSKINPHAVVQHRKVNEIKRNKLSQRRLSEQETQLTEAKKKKSILILCLMSDTLHTQNYEWKRCNKKGTSIMPKISSRIKPYFHLHNPQQEIFKISH
jgi:hypothetical protein